MKKIIDNICEEMEEYFPTLEINRDKIGSNEMIILIGESKDFEFFMEEFSDKLPDNYYFESKLFLENCNYNYNEMDLIIYEK